MAGKALALASLAALALSSGALAAEELVKPQQLMVDSSLPKAVADAAVLAARRYDTFWATGDKTLALKALAPDFMDRTLPPHRAQGIAGPLAASQGFRQAVPDLDCTVEQMLVVADRVVAHLHFTGHFTGQFNGVQGKGQAIDFIATDIYRVADGVIKENWHIEDNLTLLTQMGVVK